MDKTLAEQCAQRKREREIEKQNISHSRKQHRRTRKTVKAMLEGRAETSVHLSVAFGEFVQRLINETREVLDVDWLSEQSVGIRKRQFANLKDLVSVIRGIDDITKMVASREGPSAELDKIGSKNEELLADARKLLEKAGLKTKGL